jgi:hypothetical protein
MRSRVSTVNEKKTMNIDAGGEMKDHFEQVSLKVERQPINPLDYAGNPAELEVQYELRRLGVENSPEPQVCPTCKGPLENRRGMVGESVLICGTHGDVWEDSEDAIRRVL